MLNLRPVKARLSLEAEADLEQILQWSEWHFGRGAAIRYAELVIQALEDLEADPRRANVRLLPELELDLCSYHLANSRNRVAGTRVETPRHFILYRRAGDVLDVIRILHDSRDPARHLPAEPDELDLRSR